MGAEQGGAGDPAEGSSNQEVEGGRQGEHEQGRLLELLQE
jgi:hypothetical protein